MENVTKINWGKYNYMFTICAPLLLWEKACGDPAAIKRDQTGLGDEVIRKAKHVNSSEKKSE